MPGKKNEQAHGPATLIARTLIAIRGDPQLVARPLSSSSTTLGSSNPIRIPYIVREYQPILFKGHLAIHGAPKGCKGYIREAYDHIKEKDPTIHIRLCTCEADKAANSRKAARLVVRSAPRRSLADLLGLGDV
jgi:hypothetical protein